MEAKAIEPESETKKCAPLFGILDWFAIVLYLPWVGVAGYFLFFMSIFALAFSGGWEKPTSSDIAFSLTAIAVILFIFILAVFLPWKSRLAGGLQQIIVGVLSLLYFIVDVPLAIRDVSLVIRALSVLPLLSGIFFFLSGMARRGADLHKWREETTKSKKEEFTGLPGTLTRIASVFSVLWVISIILFLLFICGALSSPETFREPNLNVAFLALVCLPFSALLSKRFSFWQQAAGVVALILAIIIVSFFFDAVLFFILLPVLLFPVIRCYLLLIRGLFSTDRHL